MNAAAFDRRARPEGATFSTWEAGDGWPVRRMDWPQPDRAAARGSLLFANGRGDFVEKYLEALGHWHGQGWNVASFDWRGQGDSRGTIVGGHIDSFDPLVADGAALIEHWRRSTSGPHVAVAHSMGGHLLLRILAEHRPPLAAAALIAPMIGINSTPVPAWLAPRAAALLAMIGLGTRRAWKQNERPTLPGVSRARYLTTSAERYEDELWWKGAEPGFDLGPPSWGWLSAAYRSMAKLTPDALKSITLPILLVGTDRDRLVSPAAIRQAASILPRAELLMFPGAAHEILRESDEVRLQAMSRIDTFLDAHAPA